jgi:hypothetical protein
LIQSGFVVDRIKVVERMEYKIEYFRGFIHCPIQLMSDRPQRGKEEERWPEGKSSAIDCIMTILRRENGAKGQKNGVLPVKD